MEWIRFTFGPFEENPYLLVGPSGRKAMLVDPGIGSEPILDLALERGLEIVAIVNTHAHLDHVAANAFFKERTGAPIALHAADLPLLANVERQGAMFGLRVPPSPEPDVELKEGEPFLFDGVAFEVIHTPGHSPGGVCLRHGSSMLVGDTLFQGSIGRTDLPGGDMAALVRSIREKLFVLPGETVCWPGHGPETTIDAERRFNPFVSDAAVGVGGGGRG